MADTALDIVGALEIAARALEKHGVDVKVGTVRSWEKRRAAWVEAGRPSRNASRPREEPMPDPLGEVNGSPAWSWAVIEPWMRRSGKLDK
ncbi:hypothetical protein ACLQ2R_03075 [Streptosporangium sp. DT93]|uniref:hypothetical protein n=1 Tax=Streptosporangium sp. DT93 TaxID=3393428 RepID=UPI003CE715E6